MKKEVFTNIAKGVKDLKDKASQMTKDAKSSASTIKRTVQTGIEVSKIAAEKVSQNVNRDKIAQGLETASKGISLAAKGARAASKGAETVAAVMDKASDGVKNIKEKFKP